MRARHGDGDGRADGRCPSDFFCFLLTVGCVNILGVWRTFVSDCALFWTQVDGRDGDDSTNDGKEPQCHPAAPQRVRVMGGCIVINAEKFWGVKGDVFLTVTVMVV